MSKETILRLALINYSKETKTAFDEIILLPYYLNTYIEREEQFLLRAKQTTKNSATKYLSELNRTRPQT